VEQPYFYIKDEKLQVQIMGKICEVRMGLNCAQRPHEKQAKLETKRGCLSTVSF
jgi:hypothetical protein